MVFFFHINEDFQHHSIEIYFLDNASYIIRVHIIFLEKNLRAVFFISSTIQVCTHSFVFVLAQLSSFLFEQLNMPINIKNIFTCY